MSTCNINSVTVAGNLTKDPTVRKVGDGSVTNLSIANHRRYKTKEGETKEEVSFFDAVAWGKVGETIARYFTIGKPILIEGRMVQERWTEDNGTKRDKIKIRVDKIHFLEGARGKPVEGVASTAPTAPAGAPAADARPEPVAGTQVSNGEDEPPF